MSKKEAIELIVDALKEHGVKDFMNGILSFQWNSPHTKKRGQYSIYTAAENVYNKLKEKELV